MSTRQAVTFGCVTFALATTLPVPALAQRAARACTRPDTTAAWFRQQRQWLSDEKHDWSDDELRNALLSAAGLMATPPTTQLGVQRADEPSTMATSDSAVMSRLRTLAATRGSAWPTRSVVGASGVRAVWILAQRDTALQRVALHRMMESGPDEALPADVAVLEDRVRSQTGRKQLYGSQLRMTKGVLAPAPIEDSAHVDMRRDAAGLPPLRQALCAVRSGR